MMMQSVSRCATMTSSSSSSSSKTVRDFSSSSSSSSLLHTTRVCAALKRSSRFIEDEILFFLWIEIFPCNARRFPILYALSLSLERRERRGRRGEESATEREDVCGGAVVSFLFLCESERSFSSNSLVFFTNLFVFFFLLRVCVTSTKISPRISLSVFGSQLNRRRKH